MGPYIAPLELTSGTELKLDVSFFNSPWSVFVFLPDNNARDYIADRMTKFYTETDEGRDRAFQDFPKPGIFRYEYRISIRGYVRPSVGWSVGRSVGPSVADSRSTRLMAIALV